MDLLLALKPDINIKNTQGHTPLHVAAKHNNFDHAEKLIKLGAELKHIDNDGDSALFHALKNGNLEITRLIFSSGSSFNHKNKLNNNSLHHTLIHSSYKDNIVKIVKFLLERGVSSAEKNKEGKTPLELVKEHIDKLEEKEKFEVSSRTTNNIDKQNQNLLEVQTAIFNSTISNNPEKYNNYINVSEIPKGAPIDVLDTLCVGNEI